MIVHCARCSHWYDDEFRSTICPHSAFAANDGRNNFAVHDDAYLSLSPPSSDAAWERAARRYHAARSQVAAAATALVRGASWDSPSARDALERAVYKCDECGVELDAALAASKHAWVTGAEPAP